MTSFNSLGSNYTWSFVLKALLLFGTRVDYKKLETLLEKKYLGQVTLLYKGREALELALRKISPPKGSKVVINGFTCFAVYKAINNVGLDVVYADIEPDLNFSARTLEKLIQQDPQIRVVVVQNTLGYPCDIAAINTLCKKRKLILIEDLAHSIGAMYANNQEAGTMGDFTVLSFAQDKLIDSVSGGALIIRNKHYQNNKGGSLQSIPFSQRLKDRFYPLLTIIIRKTYQLGLGKVIHIVLKQLHLLTQPMAGGEAGQLHQLDGWYCALALDQLENLYGNLAHRREIALLYVKELNKQFTTQEVNALIPNSANVRFFINISKRQKLLQYLRKFGIYIADIWYDAPVAPKKYLVHTTYTNQCPLAEKASSAIINLPTHQAISPIQARRIAHKINLWLKLQYEK